MKINDEVFGTLEDGTLIRKYTISNESMCFSAIDYGCIITSICTPDKIGKLNDIVLGFDSLEEYLTKNDKYFGAIVGRFANRISNACFSIDKRTYQLDANDNGNCLHGGTNGYDRMVWNSQIIKDERGVGIKFSRISENGEQGFPGTVHFNVSYILTENNEIICEYIGKTDQNTPINLTNHSYFNLAGNGSGTIKNHIMKIKSDSYLTVDDKLIPDGKISPVKNTPFDFNESKEIGQDIDKIEPGYDHCYVLNNGFDNYITVYEPNSCRALDVYTNQPGVQLYTGNFLDGLIGKNGKSYKKHEGFCLETQQFPNAPNQKDFPNCFIDRNNKYYAKTIYKFYIK